MEQIYVQQFVLLKESTRNKLREIFRIPRSSHAEVVTDHMGVGTVVCDGTTNVDLQQLTVEKMRDYLGTAAVNETISDLLKQVVDKIEYVEPPVEIKPVEVKIEPKVEEKVEINVNKCPDCEYVNASKQGMRMHVLRKHLHK